MKFKRSTKTSTGDQLKLESMIVLARISKNSMELLSKAIKRLRPKRPEKELNDLRYMIEVLDEGIGLENIISNKLYNFLSEDLELYGESMDGLKKSSNVEISATGYKNAVSCPVLIA